MKKLIFYLTVLISCNLISNDVRLLWNANPDNQGVTHYEVFIAQSNDSTNLNLVNIGNVQHTQYGDTLSFIFDFYSDYVKGGVQAVNADTFSIMAETRIYDRKEILGIDMPVLLGMPFKKVE